METKHRKGDFLLSSRLENIENQLLVITMTGTHEKHATFEQIVKPDDNFIPGIIGLIQFENAGLAKEPVTSHTEHLIVGKAANQDILLFEESKINPDLQVKLDGEKLLLARNDINTESVSITLTKSILQKEKELTPDEYTKLTTASLKFLAMKSLGIKLNYTWKEMQQSWELIEDCLGREFNERVFLPIDYQAVDAFQVKRYTVCSAGNPKLELQSPFVSVIRRAYAHLELDFRNGSDLVKDIVSEYYLENWGEPDFNPDRYPVGIKHNALLETFVKNKQHVLLDAERHDKTIDLRELTAQDVSTTLQTIEEMLNGFSEVSFYKAMMYIRDSKPRDWDAMITIVCKPGKKDKYLKKKLPKFAN